MFVTQDTCEEIGWDQSVHVPEEQQTSRGRDFCTEGFNVTLLLPPPKINESKTKQIFKMKKSLYWSGGESSYKEQKNRKCRSKMETKMLLTSEQYIPTLGSSHSQKGLAFCKHTLYTLKWSTFEFMKIYFMRVCIFPKCVSVYNMYVWCL